MGKLTDRLDKINERLRKKTLKVDAKVEEAKQAVEDAKSEVETHKDKVAENVQTSINERKEKVAAKREAKDRKHWEEYIGELLDYAESCANISTLFEAEAILAAATAAAELCDYIEKYGSEEE